MKHSPSLLSRENTSPPLEHLPPLPLPLLCVQGLNELESFMPDKLFAAKISVPRPQKLNYKQRQEAKVQNDLR
jgi:hypothetical protein